MILSAGERLGPYEILSPLGSGGMGQVYKAVDTRLGRHVAIKVLPDDAAADSPQVDRLTREARAASALNHQNIAHIYEIADAGGRRFIAMEYVEGSILDVRGRGWPIDQVLAVGVQLADALDAAHGKGIVHRDIKPGNLMLTARGQLKVLDFGIAKMIAGDSASEMATAAATGAGSIVGTVGAFSPEQALGRDVDARSDLFSAGVVLYGLATGHLPFAGGTAIETADRLLHAQPDPPSRVSPAVPAALDRIILKCLEKDRERRYQSAADMRVDLEALRTGGAIEQGVSRFSRRSVVVAAALLVAGALIASAVYLAPSWSPHDVIESVAVLPFVNESADPQTEYLSDGIPDILIDALSQIQGLRVIALSSTLRYKGSGVVPDVKQVGAALGVRAVVAGRVRQLGNDLRIAVEIVDTRDDRRLWGHQYERTTSDIVIAQGQLGRDVADRLRGRLTAPEAERVSRRQTDDSEAYRLYLQGRYFWNRYSEEGFKQAIEFFKQAIDRDPSYALAYAGLADAHMQLGTDFQSPGRTYPQGRQYAERALQLDAALGEAHASLGMYAMWYDRDWPRAEREFVRAIQLRPNFPGAHHFYAHYLDARGRTEESIAEILRAHDHDPLSAYLSEEVGWTYYHAHRFDEATVWLRRSLELDPRFDFGHFTMAQVNTAKGAYAEALKALDAARGLSDWNGLKAERACALALLGRKKEAAAIASALAADSANSYVDPYSIATVYVALGDRDRAFDWLSNAVDSRSAYVAFLTRDVKLDPLHGDPRFGALAARIGL